ncbi:MAG: hypothetical protein IH631_00325 [Candidatus Thorarchaeota archaeon]|nr:hypothetical protein [Candidatus Thorarchaeota archaeon]
MCVSKRDRAHYKKHKVEVKKAQKLRLTRMRDRYNMWKSQQGCCFCFETEACCLDLHHVDPKEKDINVSSLLKTRYSWERLMEEANKCVVICSNCHRKLHAGLLALS